MLVTRTVDTRRMLDIREEQTTMAETLLGLTTTGTVSGIIVVVAAGGVPRIRLILKPLRLGPIGPFLLPTTPRVTKNIKTLFVSRNELTETFKVPSKALFIKAKKSTATKTAK